MVPKADLMYHLKVARLVSVVEQKLLTFPECLNSPMVASKVHPAQSLVFCIELCQLLFVILYFFFWALYCLSFDLWLLITPLVYSHFYSSSVQTMATPSKQLTKNSPAIHDRLYTDIPTSQPLHLQLSIWTHQCW